MIGRVMAPAIEKMAAIDLSKFVISIISAEYAIKITIIKLKNEFVKRGRGGAA